jgi:hypothetical protein
MATKQTNIEETTATVDDRVEVFIPKGYANDEPNLFVSVNGVNYILPKGKTSKVPPHVAYEINRSLKAQQKQDENIDMMAAKPE